MKYFALIIVLFWNVENYYDYFDNGTNSSDTEFSPLGAKHWTKKKFLAKCNAIAKTIFWVSDAENVLPDIVAFAEIENSFVLRKLISETGLKKTAYKYVHYNSPDHRGIDVALLYNAESLHLISSSPIKQAVDSTRDILLACFSLSNGDSLAVIVNHFPSKYGGSNTSDNRITAAQRLIFVQDSLTCSGWKNILAIGDFNEALSEEASLMIASRMIPLKSEFSGSIKFDGKWELIDQAFISPSLFENRTTFSVLFPPFLLTQDKAHSGLKPLRTYSGPQYLGGVSDHLPIMVKINDARK